MTEFIDLIWCKVIMLFNSLPIYQMHLVLISIPVLVILVYYFKIINKTSFITLILLFIWVSQVLIGLSAMLYYKL